MERRSRVHLDHPAIRGRIREPQVRRAPVTGQTDLHGKARVAQTSESNASSIVPKQPETSAPVVRDTSITNAQNKPVANSEQHSAQAKPLATSGTPLRRIRTTPIKADPNSTAHLPRQTRSGVLRRQMVRGSSKTFRPKKHRSAKPFVFAGVAACLLVIAGLTMLTVVKKLRAPHETTSVLAKQTTTSNTTNDLGTSATEMPSETNPPTDISNYTVGDDMPRFLVIDKLGVNARIRRVGSDSDNAVRGPSNIFDVGWYENSSEPGENGTVLLDGHVSGETKRGVFYGLNTLKKGDKITVERGDGKIIRYTVMSTEQSDFENLDIKKVMTSSVPGKPGLNLMTSTGSFNVRTNQYEKRVIVYAVQD